jgi:hypothetical protein
MKNPGLLEAAALLIPMGLFFCLRSEGIAEWMLGLPRPLRSIYFWSWEVRGVDVDSQDIYPWYRFGGLLMFCIGLVAGALFLKGYIWH